MKHLLQRTICVIFMTVGLIVACAPKGPHKLVAPSGPLPRKGGESVTFASLRPILKKNCASCHPSRSAPDWQDEAQALQYVRNGKLLKRVVVEKSMPQLGSPESVSMTSQERSLVEAWVASVQSGGGPGPVNPVEPNPGPFAPVEKCVACHGILGDGPMPLVPYLAGQNTAYLTNQLEAYRTGQRRDRVLQTMNSVAASLTAKESELVVTYFSRLRWESPAVTEEIPDVEKKLKRGEELVKNIGCTGCHAGEQGRPLNPDWPVLVGQKRDYIVFQLKAFRDGQRSGTVMPEVITSQNPPLTDEDFESLAVYLNRLGWARPRAN